MKLQNKTDPNYVCLKETGDATVELAVMGVLKEYHRKGLGKQLFEAEKKSQLKKDIRSCR